MGSKSDYLEDAILDHVLGVAALTSPTVYLALYTVAPTDSTAGTEVSTSGTGYARIAATFAAASGGATSLSGTHTFPTATGDWGTVVAWAVMDSDVEGAGNVLYYGDVSPNKAVNNGDTASFASGECDITET